ncbi:non-ribosomal peptide synthetase [Nonomuraea sediminis]|uniref:non-ribosomal peptide synthetase n=1 Tax=Nonomuraea sediminis TaxID=2835864 RepID=UPI001BDBB1B2|nr:non-ribosomal peptide synthetase [Nonomuraea sediminis]
MTGYPLSSGQRRLWFTDRLDPDSTEYLELSAVRLSGEVDVGALAAAFGDVVARHEILRTHYAVADGEPRQLVDPPSEVPVRLVDLSAAPEEGLRDLLDAELDTPIDLVTGPVFRLTLARLADREHAAVLAIHHIAYDGWSDVVLYADWWRCYADRLAGRDPRAGQAAPRYRDHAARQREELAGGLMADGLDFWRDALDGAEPLELRGDWARPQVRSHDGGLHVFTVPAPLAARLRALGRQHRATLFSVLLAGFELLLARYTQRRDLVVGTPVAGRTEAAFEDAIGFFTNTLPLRTRLPADPTFAEALELASDTVLDALDNQDVPFDQIVDALRSGSDLSRTPLFQIAFVMQNNPPLPQPDGLRAVRVPPHRRHARYDLGMELTEEADGSLTGRLAYATALYGEPAMNRLAGHYLHLLSQVATDPERRLAELDLMPPAERRTVEQDWVTGPDVAGSPQPLHRLVERHADTTPDAPAVSCGGLEIGYAQLDRQANRLAHHLRGLGVTNETRVALCLNRGPQETVTELAILKAGGAFVPLDPAHPDERLHDVLREARVQVIVTESELADRFPPHLIIVVLDEEDLDGLPCHRPETACDPASLAYVIFTSGSTGRPKGVAVPHAGLHAVAAHQRELLGIAPGDRVLRFASPSFDASVYESVLALAHGATLCFAGAEALRPGQPLAATLAEEHVTAALIPPSCLAATPAADLPELRVLTVGGEACPASVVAAWGTGRRLVNLYGPTEVTILATAGDCEEGAGAPPIGRPIHGARVYVLDGDLNPVPAGVPGEIYVGGAGVVRGYLYQPERTAARFVPDPFTLGARLYRTGDQARWLPDGRLEYLGRGDGQVKIRGHRVELGEVEAVIAGHPGVERAVATVLGDGTGERRLAGYALAAGTAAPDAAELRAFLRSKVPEYLVPAHLFVLPEFPLTTSGKIDYRALPASSALPARGAAGEEAELTPLESDLLAIWRETLESGDITVDDSFFDVGGDSIRAVRMVGLMRERGLDVSVQDLFTHKSIAALCAVLNNREPQAERRAAVRPFELIDERTRAGLPEDVVDAYPAARLQTGMLYEMLRSRSDHSYHDVTSFYVRDDQPFSPQAMRAAADEVAARHDALRTSFDLTGQDVLQLVHESAIIPFDVVDLTGLAEEEQEACVAAFIHDQRDRPFDVTRAPMLHLVVHVLGADAWRLSMIQCHAIMDGWSEHLVLTELLDAYRGVAHEPPALRYADFVPLEQAALESSQARAFWRDLVRDAEPWALPERWGGGSGYYSIEVPADDLWPDLRRLASAADAHVRHVVHAAFLRTLGAITGQERFVSGLVCNGRPEERDGDRVVGLFLNTVPLALSLEALSWRELVRRVAGEHEAIWPHRRFPLGEIQHEWQGHGRLVDVLFNYVDFHVVDRTSVDLDRTLDLGQSEIALDVTVAGDRILLNGRRDLVERCYGERMAAILREVLESMAANPGADPRPFALGPSATARQVAGGEGEPSSHPGTLHGLFAERAAATPHRVAVEDEHGQHLTYAELDAQAERLAGWLHAAGAGPEHVVGICAWRSPALVVAILGILKCGAAYLPLDPRLPAERVATLLADAKASLVVTEASPPAALYGAPADILRLDQAHVQACGQRPPAPVHPDGAAYVIYTSGSTGVPNGVVATHGGVAARVLDTVTRRGITPADRVMLRSGIGFDAAVWETFVPLLASATLVIAPEEAEHSAETVARSVHDGRVTVLQAVPSMLDALSAEPGWHERDAQPAEPDALRLIYSGGDRLDGALARRVVDDRQVELVNAYGPTECSVGITESRWREDAVDGPVPIGRPLAGVGLMILGLDGGPVPDGVVGELHVSGPALARGYLGRPALTAARFLPDPFHGPGERMYGTGDLVRRDPDGELMFVGRIDHQVKVSGARVEPGEVERALAAHPAVNAAAVLPVTERGRTRLIAYHTGDPALGGDRLRHYLLQRLPAHCVPGAFVHLDALPLTYAGKLDRAALPPAPAPSEPGGPPPRTAAERLVAGVWSQLLGVDGVGVHDDYFRLGGDSLTLAKLSSRLRAESGAHVPLRELFTAVTVEAQARLVATYRVDAEPLAPGVAGARAPLSFGQQRLWFLDRLEPGNPEYLVPLGVAVPEDAGEDQVRAALEALAARHAVLRTRYEVERGEPVQVVDPEPVIDLEAVRGRPLAQVVAEELRGGFDLERGPVWRARLIRDSGVLLLVVHHIACDGWSMGVLRRELAELLHAGAPAPAPRQSYADFARWQRDRLDGEPMERLIGYWRRELDGLAPLELPTDRPRPPRWRPDGDTVEVRLPAQTARQVAELGRQSGATPFMALLAVFAELLRRYSGQDDVAVGTPVAGRVRPELDDLVGFFVNTLVLRCATGGEQSFRALTDRVRQAALGAFAHQELPFERLVDELQPERDPSRTPLVQVMFELADAAAEDGREVEAAVLAAWRLAKFDLTMTLAEQADGSYTGTVEFATALFDRESVELLAARFVRLAELVSAGPDTPLSELDLRTPAELGWNDTARDRPPLAVHELIERQRARTPDAIAVEYGERKLTYAELDARAGALARRLRDLGVTLETPVGVRMERSPELVTALLAVLKAGGCFVPLEPDYPASRVADTLAAAGAPVCLIDPGSPPTGGPGADLPVTLECLTGPGYTRPVSPDGAVAIYYTSGSTGRPKGVLCTHRGWVNRLLAMQETMPLAPGEAVLQKTTVVFDDAPVECFWPLLAGGRVVVLPPGEHRDPAAILTAAARHRITAMLFVPSMLRLILAELDERRLAELDALRHVGTSGEALDPGLVRCFVETLGGRGAILHNHWGVTEAAIDSTHHACGQGDARGEGAVTIGGPITGNRVHVLDADLREQPAGIPGELYVGGTGVARGYLGQPALTAAAFLPDPFEAGGRLYRTGDRAVRRPDGTITFLGRVDRQVKIRGVRVEPGEIEHAITAHHGVADAAVTPWAVGGDLRLAGFFVPAVPDGPSPREVAEHLRERLPGYLVPSVLTAIDAIPRTASGKTDHRALPEPDASGAIAPEARTAPRTVVEERLVEIWTELLGVEVGTGDDFFQAGGHSLLAARLVALVGEEFGVEVPLRGVFDRPTVAALAEAVEEQVRAEVERMTEEELRAECTSEEESRV